ncbi:MAG: secretin N-terminal domain-containing protein [Limisphaerales bacterium]
MNTIKHFLLIACLSAGIPILAAEPVPAAPTKEAPSAPAKTIQTSPGQPPPAPTEAGEAATNAVAAPATPDLDADLVTNAVAGTNAVTGTNAIAAAGPAMPPVVVGNGTNGLRINFHNARLNLVLDYLSDAAGFVIDKEADVRGTVDVQGKDLTKDEAVEVLNSALRKNGYALIRKGRILTIVAQDGVNHTDTPIDVGSNPEEVERGDEVVTQIIPVKYASVSQLVPNLELLLPTTATLSPNESANSLILVATKTDVKRMLKIINALDTSIASVSSIRVIPLKYADAKDTATLITSLFGTQGTGQGGAGGGIGRGNLFAMMAAGGFGGGNFGGRGGNTGGRGGSSGGGGGAAAAKVVAVGDDRSNALVVTAPADLLATIETMVKEIDQEVTDVTELRVFRLVNADASEVADQLATLFPDPTLNTANQNNNIPFFMRGPGFGRGGTTSTANTSARMQKMGRVLAVPDPRTSALIVMASKTLMPQIADMITELDSDKGRKEVVGYFDLQYADPQDVYNNMQDLFNRVSVRPTSSSANPMLGTSSPMYQREKANTQPTQQGAISTIGGSSGGVGGR